MNAIIRVVMSEAGRKADILAGGNGAEVQEITVTPKEQEFPAVVAAGKIGSGTVLLDCTQTVYDYIYGHREAAKWDYLPTAAEVLYYEECDRAAYTARKQQVDTEKAETRAREDAEDAAAIAAWSALPLAGRIENGRSGPILALPKLHRGTVPEDNAALAEARAECARIKDEAAAVAKAAQDAANQKRAEWRAANGLETGDIALRIEDGALAVVPEGCWESHKRGKNWLAAITINPTAPGGLERVFADKARGDSYYILPSLSPGDAVEFGADYYSGGGRKSPARWYGFVVKTFTGLSMAGEDATYIVIRKYGTGKTAVKEGEKWAKEHLGATNPANAIDACIARINSEGAIVPAK